MDTSKPDIAEIKKRLATLSPGVVGRIAQEAPAVATLLLDCKHLVAYVEELGAQDDADLRRDVRAFAAAAEAALLAAGPGDSL